jgi:DegV family protein with EDD domain
MKKVTVAIVADTTSEINREIANEYRIRLVPLYINIDGTSYRETDIDLSWFCRNVNKWKNKDRLITSSAPSVGDFVNAYRELSKHADSVLAVCLSSKFSATFTSAVEAKKIVSGEIPDKSFEVFDTMTVCGAQMLITIEAARAAKAGMNLEEVVRHIDFITDRVNYISLSSDVSGMAKCGRLHRARVLAMPKVASTVLMQATKSTGGEHQPLGRYKTRKKAMERIFELVRERSGKGNLHIAINHADALTEAIELKDRALSQFQCKEVFICQSLPLVTYHEGIGNLKFSWWSKD